MGHAARRRPGAALALPLDALHLAAVAAWLGGLAVLLLAVLPARDAGRLAAVLPRWSRWAAGSVAVIVATGLFASWREVRDLSALPGTRYGQLLLVKAALVARDRSGARRPGATGSSARQRHVRAAARRRWGSSAPRCCSRPAPPPPSSR